MLMTMTEPAGTNVKNYGSFIRQLRLSRKLSQAALTEELAARGQHKYDYSSVGKWEKGSAMHPSDPEFLRAFAEILGVTEAELLNAMGHQVGTPPPELPEEMRRALINATPDQLDKLAAAAAFLAKTQRERDQK